MNGPLKGRGKKGKKKGKKRNLRTQFVMWEIFLYDLIKVCLLEPSGCGVELARMSKIPGPHFW